MKKARKRKSSVKRLFLAFLILPLISSSALRPGNAFAQPADNEPQVRKQQRINPDWLDKFSGFGRREDFETAMKEERAGWRRFLEKDYDQAIKKFKIAVQIYPNLPCAYLGTGESIEKAAGSNQDAEDAYRTAIKLNTDDYRAWHKLGGILYNEKKYPEARKALANAQSLNPPPRERRLIDRMIGIVDSAE